MVKFQFIKSSNSNGKTLIVFLSMLIIAFSGYAQSIPQQISYQGKLLENGSPVTGVKSMVFSIGNWSETHATVSVTNGLYSVTLGETVPIPASVFTSSPNVQLQISVDGTTLSPSTYIRSVGYAYQSEEAANSGKLGSQDGDYYLSWSNFIGIPVDIADGDDVDDADNDPLNEIQVLSLAGNDLSLSNGGGLVSLPNGGNDNDWTINGTNMYSNNSGNVGIGNTNPSEKLVVEGNIDLTSYLYFDKDNHSTKIFRSAYSLYVDAPNGKILFDNPTFAIDCQNDKIGIGKTSPAYKLDVAGDINFTGNLYQNGSLFSSGNLWSENGSNIYHMNGDVGLGMSNPLYKLDVQGDINSSSVYRLSGDIVLSTPGSYSVFLGATAGLNTTSSYKNTFIGYASGRYNESGENNTYLGYKAGYKNINGQYNLCIGDRAGYNSKSDYNVFLGYYSGFDNVNGNHNTMIGVRAGENNLGDDNVFIGYDAGSDEQGSGRLYIDNTNTSTPLIWGNFDANQLVINGNSSNNSNNRTFFVSGTAGGNSGWYQQSDLTLKENIQTISHPLQKVKQLRGVTYEWKNNNLETGKQIGFIAQEVEKVIPEVVANEGIYSMQYGPLTALLVEAMKEQQQQIESLQTEVNNLKSIIYNK